MGVHQLHQRLIDLSGIESVIEGLEFPYLSYFRRSPNNIELLTQTCPLTGISTDDSIVLESLPNKELLNEVRLNRFEADFSAFVSELSQVRTLKLNRVNGEHVSKLKRPRSTDT